MVLEDGGTVTVPVTFNPSSPGSPLTRARNLKLEKLSVEREYLEVRNINTRLSRSSNVLCFLPGQERSPGDVFL